VPPEHLLSKIKKEIKNKINISKITFDAFELLNARNLRQNFYFNIFNQCPGGTV
jgi:sugar-specific transcriptional regulator TrmB